VISVKGKFLSCTYHEGIWANGGIVPLIHIKLKRETSSSVLCGKLSDSYAVICEKMNQLFKWAT
jgi:hypothetical protein